MSSKVSTLFQLLEENIAFVPLPTEPLSEIVDIINKCAVSVNPPKSKVQTAMAVPQGSLEYKLMTTYLSYLPRHKVIHDLKMNVDQRGSFTELIHTLNNGQVSINISKPGITKENIGTTASGKLLS